MIFSGPNPPIVPVTFNNPGGSGLNPTATYSTDIGPDIVAKVSADPGWGHFEIYGLGRAFRSRANFSNHTILGGGWCRCSPADRSKASRFSSGLSDRQRHRPLRERGVT